MRQGAGTSRDYPNIWGRYLVALSRILKTGGRCYLLLRAGVKAGPLPALGVFQLCDFRPRSQPW
ncbi:hypothetical protein ARTHRO9AX_180718 [Arthrobacter sp. 9AX]|nr:hypothetical protein ARTHRO9AX_180718 [Arthrobacter sp. 9AX]